MPEKNNSKLIHGLMKNAKHLPKERSRNRENVECIGMYQNVSDKKTELYLYNSKNVIHV